MQHEHVGQNRHVRSFAADRYRAERDLIIPLGHYHRHVERRLLLTSALGAVQQLVFEKHHGVAVADRRQHQTLGVVGIGRADDLQPRRVHEVRLGALSVLRTARRCADRQPQHHRHGDLAVAHVAHFRGLIDDLVHRAEDEIAVLHFRDRLHAGHRRPHRRADDGDFGDRRVHDPVVAELLRQSQRHGEPAAKAAGDSDVLTDDEHGRIGTHRHADRIAQALDDRHSSGLHRAASISARSAKTCS